VLISRKLATILLSTALTLPVLPGPAAATAPGSASPSEFLGAVTLLTGDHVTVRRVGATVLPTVEPGPGREHVHFAVSGTGGQLLVVPNDAWAPLNAGRLDRRLFDVAALLRDGFGDAARSDVPLIMGGVPSSASATIAVSTSDFIAVRQPKASTADFWNSLRQMGTLAQPASRIWLDGVRHPNLDESVRQIGAPRAWRAGLDGKDVTVAVLDTGIDDTHPDFRGRIAGLRNFTADPDIHDAVGHGTHVASTIAGTGRASDGRYTGVAPGARLLIGKVCQGNGCAESAILAGMEWAAAAGARIVNLSLGGPDTADDDPLEVAIDRLSAERGTLFVVAAGNDGGRGAETIDSPGSADSALTVGAVDKRDALAGFSGRGPRVRDGALKPDIVAPGVEITAARSRFSTLGARGDRYVTMSGTSMATPHVAGAAAIVAQQHPDWTGARIKAALMGSARPLDGVGAYEQGAGRVDVARAIRQTAVAEPAGVSAGRQPWPHQDDQTIIRTVGYHNPGATPLRLRLATTVTGPDGQPVPDGMFRLSSAELTVPAMGRAEVRLAVDTAMAAAEGTFSAHLLATSGNQRIVTPVGVGREPESYDLTLRPLDDTGTPTDLTFQFVFGVGRAGFRPVPSIAGSGTLRVRRGRYHVDAVVSTRRPDGLFDSSKVVHPTVDITGDTTLTLDGRVAEPIGVSFERPGVTPRAVVAAYSRFTAHGTLNTGVLGDDLARIHLGQVGDPLPRLEMVANIGGTWAVPDDAGGVERSTVTYDLAWFDYDRLPTGFTRHVVDGELARVEVTYRAQERDKRATKVWVAREPELGIGVGQGFAFRLPLSRTEFHNVDGLGWSAEFQQWSFVKKLVHTESVLTGGVVDHQPGRSYVEDWNSAVFGPGFPGETDWASRFDDTLAVNVPLYSDAALDHSGVSEVDSAATVLYRDGTKIGETKLAGQGQFEVPPELGSYRLETQARRGGVSALSTRISCAWTFTSAHPTDPVPDPKDPDGKGKGGNALPLMSIRFAPPNLNLRNEVRPGVAIVPVTVGKPNDAPEATVTGLTVDVSFDDGRTWQAAEVSRERDSGSATVRIDHPRSASFASLRARATDSAGNTAEQTIIRAYGIR
jgi:subtilisin family serine protease